LKTNLPQGTLKLAFGQWYSFAIVLDGSNLRGTIHVESSYGYNSAGTDNKVI